MAEKLSIKEVIKKLEKLGYYKCGLDRDRSGVTFDFDEEELDSILRQIRCDSCEAIIEMKITNEACVPWGSESHVESFSNGFKYAKQKAKSIIKEKRK